MEPYTLQDVYLTTGFMAFGFAEGFREDPLVSTLMNKLGSDYLNDLIIDWEEMAEKIPVFDPAMEENLLSISTHTKKIMENLPVAPWLGSNSWVIGPSKTAEGKVLFANDTHMGFSQPSVWYEAHIEAPGLSSYGNYAAGFPFPILGHNRFMAVGLTMFENDDTDFYVEKPVADNPNQYWYGEEKLNFSTLFPIDKGDFRLTRYP
jgi:penicillin amidase